MNDRQKKRIRSKQANNDLIRQKVSDRNKRREAAAEHARLIASTPPKEELVQLLEMLDGVKTADVVLKNGLLIAVHIVSRPGFGRKHYKHVVKVAFSAAFKFELPSDAKFHVAEI